MTEMNVLFLALGATRRRAVVEESARVTADGGTAVVIVEQASAWRKETFAPGVEVVDLATVARHAPVRIEQLLLYRAPGFLLRRVLGRGPLRAPVHRAAGAYQRRIADRIHRRLFLPLYRRVWGDVRTRVLDREVSRRAPFRSVVVADPLSMPDVVRMFRTEQTGGGAAPKLCYSIDHVVREAVAAHVD